MGLLVNLTVPINHLTATTDPQRTISLCYCTFVQLMTLAILFENGHTSRLGRRQEPMR